jgi:hypothetical protein
MFHWFAGFPPDFVEYSSSAVDSRSNRCKKVVARVGLMYGTPMQETKNIRTNMAGTGLF